MNTLLLPKKYLSWSAFEKWVKNPEQFKREYFEQGKKLDTKYLRFGKKVAEMIENGTYKDILPDLVVYPEREYRIEVEVMGVPLLSYLDGYDPVDNVLGEYKTGKNPWTKAKVQKHGQLLYYAVGLRKKTGTMPRYCDLHWLPTEESDGGGEFWGRVDGRLKLTGKIQTFRRYFDERELDRMERDILRVATEISDAYREFISQL